MSTNLLAGKSNTNSSSVKGQKDGHSFNSQLNGKNYFN